MLIVRAAELVNQRLILNEQAVQKSLSQCLQEFCGGFFCSCLHSNGLYIVLEQAFSHLVVLVFQADETCYYEDT